MATSTNSSSWVRTYTKTDATKYQIAYRSNNTWKVDANGKAVSGSFSTNLQVDKTAIDGGVTGGNAATTWTTAATRGPGAKGIWERKYIDEADTTLGFVLPDASWSDLNDRSSDFNSQVNNISSNAIAKYFIKLGYGKGSGLSTQAGAMREIANSQGSNSQGNPSDETTGANTDTLSTVPEQSSRPRDKYQSRYTYYYPIALKANRDQDKMQISVLKYKPRAIKGFKIAKSRDKGGRAGYTQRVLGSVFLPVPGSVQDSNNVVWSSNEMDPAKLALANAFFENVQKGSGAIDGGIDSLEKIAKQVGENSGEVKTGVAALLTKAATGGSVLTRTTGAIVNPNMELLFSGPQLRTFTFSWKMSPRDYEESEMIKKIIRMFKQSQAVKRSESMLFLKSPNTYAIRYLTARGREHGYLPKIKECALVGFNMNYTPDGNYQTYENSSMVAYEMSMSFNELEPIYHDEYTALDGDRDESIGF